MTATEIARRALVEHLASSPHAELLARYAARRDPEAFAGLVHQFGPMVLGVCRRVLGPTPDADDAFQAVFVALARKAGSLRDASALPAWLHRVALRTSRKALAARDNPQPTTAEPTDAADPFADVAWKDVRRVLDEELDALPKKLRGPVVLCWLDGLTQDEAAGKLGLSLNTLKRRLDAGRELLRSRLTRRGLAPALAATAVLIPGGLRAHVPPALTCVATDATRLVKPLAVAGSRLIALAAVGFVAACGLAFVPADRAPQVAPEPRPAAQAKPTDAVPVEPLPKGAVARFGGTQYRVPERLFSFTLSPDGKLVAVGGSFGVRLHEAATWRLVHDLPTDAGRGVYTTNHLAFSPDGKVLGFTKNGRFAFLWDVKSGKELHRFDSGGEWVWGKSGFTPDGLFAIADEEKLRFFDPANGREVRSVTVKRPVSAMSPDGKHFVTQSFAGGPFPRALHDAAGKELHTFDERATWWGGVSFSPDGKRLTLISGDGSEVQVWDVATRKIVKRLKAPPTERDPRRTGYGSGFTADGREIWLEMPAGDILRWDATTFADLPGLACGTGLPMSGLIPTDGGKTLLLPTALGWVRVFDAATGKEHPVPGRYRATAVLAQAPDGKLVAVGDSSGRIDLLDTATGKPVRVVREKGDPVRWLVFSPDSALLAIGEQRDADQPDKRVARARLLRVSDGQEFWSREKEADKSIWSLVPLGFADGGDYLVLAHYPKDARIWDTAAGKELRRMPATNANAAPSPDGKLLATDEHGEVVLFDFATGKEARRVEVDPVEKEKRQSVGAARFAWSGDGKVLATTLPEDHVCVLDAATGKERKRFPVYAGDGPEGLGRGDHSVNSLALSPDGKRLAAAAINGKYVAVWDTATGKQVARMGHDFQVESVAFTPDGKGVITFGVTGLGYRWDIEKLVAVQKK